MTAASISTIAITYAHEFRRQLPALRDGDAEAVHDARVATRRLREILAVLISQEDCARRVRKLIRKAGRELGRVRELDVMHDILAREAQINPAVATAVVVARRALAERQTAARRRMIKRVERLDLEDLPERLSLREGPIDWILDRYAVGSTWGPVLRDRLARRAATVARAVSHAGGVYFPRRMHRLRVAAKKLRYTIEIASEMGLWRPPHMLQDLREVQRVLGDLHDAQVLIDEVDDLVADGPALAEVPALKATLQARAAEYHASYLALRDRLSVMSVVVDRFAGRATVDGWRRRLAAARH